MNIRSTKEWLTKDEYNRLINNPVLLDIISLLQGHSPSDDAYRLANQVVTFFGVSYC